MLFRSNTVSTDMNSGAHLLAKHIKKLGYRNILIVSNGKKARYDYEIIDSFREALKDIPEVNKPIVVDFVRTYPAEEESLPEIDKYLRPPHRIDLIVIVHAENVYPIMAALERKKTRVPQDVALMSLEEGLGFDLIHSPVTALRKPLPAMALKVANMIWSEVKNQGKGKYRRQVTLVPELIIRKSCGSQ